MHHANTVLNKGTPEEITAVEKGEAAVSTTANFFSSTNEWYTPKKYIDTAKCWTR